MLPIISELVIMSLEHLSSAMGQPRLIPLPQN